MFVRAYLRASTDEQDATRARQQLETFAAEHALRIAAFYVENESGAKLARPELFRLLSDARPGDILLVEQVDRLSRLTTGDWARLKAELAARHVRVVALDLPTSWMMATPKADEFTGRMFDAINGMLLDVLAAVARKDYEDRRRRQAQGQEKARAAGRYKGRPEDVARNAGIASMLKAGLPWSQIQAATHCSRATIAKIAKRDAQPRPAFREPNLEAEAVVPSEFPL
jgi:DNA invertase Pin-like site-specific DNA recombinase